MNQIDFLPKRIRHQRRVYRQLQRQGLALIAFVGMLGALGYVNQVRIANAEDDLADLEFRASELTAQLRMAPELKAQLADGQVKRRISRELGSRLTVNALLAELGRLLPPSTCLTRLDCSTVEVGPVIDRSKGRRKAPMGVETAVNKRVRLVIDGVAPNTVDVADFITAMQRSLLFTDVNMGFTKMVVLKGRNREAHSFQISCLVAE